MPSLTNESDSHSATETLFGVLPQVHNQGVHCSIVQVVKKSYLTFPVLSLTFQKVDTQIILQATIVSGKLYESKRNIASFNLMLALL